LYISQDSLTSLNAEVARATRVNGSIFTTQRTCERTDLLRSGRAGLGASHHRSNTRFWSCVYRLLSAYLRSAYSAHHRLQREQPSLFQCQTSQLHLIITIPEPPLAPLFIPELPPAPPPPPPVLGVPAVIFALPLPVPPVPPP